MKENQHSHRFFRHSEICLLTNSPMSPGFQNCWNCFTSHPSCPSVPSFPLSTGNQSLICPWAAEEHWQPSPWYFNILSYLTPNRWALRYTSDFPHISCYLPNSSAISCAISHFSSPLQQFPEVLCLEIAFSGSACGAFTLWTCIIDIREELLLIFKSL